MILLLNPHNENNTITNIDLVAIEGSKAVFYWSDGQQRLGSIVERNLAHWLPYSVEGEGEEQQTIVEPLSEANVATAIDGWLKWEQARQEARNKPAEPTLDSKMYAIFKELPIELRVAFDPLRVLVDGAIKLNDYELGRAHIANATVPAELQPLKDMLMGMLPK